MMRQIENASDSDYVSLTVKLRSLINYICLVDKQNKTSISLIQANNLNNKYTLVRNETQPISLDFLSSFTKMKVPVGKHFILEKLPFTSFEYEFVKRAFKSTRHGEIFNDGGSGRSVKKIDDTLKVIQIEKIYNPIIFDKFKGELQRNLRKYPHKSIWDIVKFLFNGSRSTDPMVVLNSEYGIDQRFAQVGMFGTGAYFSNNSNYCFNYDYQRPDGNFNLFFTLVVVGESISLQPD
jgi:hypothetical protein